MWLLIFVCWLQIGYGQALHDLVISEVMADPSPQIGLPNQEYVEILNRSKDTIDLFGLYFIAGNDTCRIKEHSLALPGDNIILCKTSAFHELKPFGKCMAVPSFPSINNEEEILAILSTDKRTLHALEYRLDQHSNAVKQRGGWSIEMSDYQRPCITENNFLSSIDPTGGTPGRNNSVLQPIQTTLKPLNAFMIDSMTLMLRFSESVDSFHATKLSSYRFSKPIEANRIEVVPPLFNKVIIRLDKPLAGAINLESMSLLDCSGKPFEEKIILASSLSKPVKGDIVINELMFNPASGGSDYAEIFNVSARSFDLRKLMIAGKNSSGTIQVASPLSFEEIAIYPGEYKVISTNKYDLTNAFHTSEDNICLVNDFPSLPDDMGTVILADEQGNILDEVSYHHEWHNPFITEESGIALERLDPSKFSNDGSNWTSASSLLKGTPGKMNSQNIASGSWSGGISVEQTIFSPDNDGIDDQLIIKYGFKEPGMMGNIRVYNVHGYAIINLMNNQLLPSTGWARWDGQDSKGQKCPPGLYIINASFHSNTGTVIKFREAITLAKRF